MSEIIEHFFSSLETELAQSPAIQSYLLRRQDIALLFGAIRVKTWLKNGGVLEFSEAVAEVEGGLERLKYSYHWQDENGRLLKRWDNAPHFPNLPHAPHHIHLADGSVEGTAAPPSLATILSEIEPALKE
jgi:hypothetical protein